MLLCSQAEGAIALAEILELTSLCGTSRLTLELWCSFF